jgi:DNA repair protein RadC
MPEPLPPDLYAAEPALRDWPDDEKPRERLSRLGARNLSDAELLALLLRTGSHKSSAVNLGRHLHHLARARGGFEKLDLNDLQSLPGLGPAKSASILAALEWGRRRGLADIAPPAFLRRGADAYQALRSLLEGRREEHIVVLALDARRKLMATDLISQGTLTQALAHPRDVFRSAIKLEAAGIILGHNHPSGSPQPSPEDHALTNRLREGAQLLAIPLLDHVIVGAGSFYSYADMGWPRF